LQSKVERLALVIVADGHKAQAAIFARERGGGAVSLASGPRLILASLSIAVRLKLELSDGNAEALSHREPRTWLHRIPFAQSAPEIERLAEEVGLLPKRVRLNELAACASLRRHGGIFFS